MVIDDAAVQTLDGKPVVFVQEGEAFQARPVELGRRGTSDTSGNAQRGHIIEVLAGVQAGERYVGKNSFTLKAEIGKSEAGHEH